MGTILLIILILLLIGALPAWPYSSGWGYWPSWRSRIDSFDFDNSRFNGTPVKRCAFGLIRPCTNSRGRSFRGLVCPEAVE
jgi:hypothetical protein